MARHVILKLYISPARRGFEQICRVYNPIWTLPHGLEVGNEKIMQHNWDTMVGQFFN